MRKTRGYTEDQCSWIVGRTKGVEVRNKAIHIKDGCSAGNKIWGMIDFLVGNTTRSGFGYHVIFDNGVKRI